MHSDAPLCLVHAYFVGKAARALTLPLAFLCPMQVVRLLLDNRADVHARNNNGYVRKPLGDPFLEITWVGIFYVNTYHCFSTYSTNRQVVALASIPFLSASRCRSDKTNPRHVHSLGHV